MSSCNFHVGQKVVCINNGALTNELGNTWETPMLEIGRVYTVTIISRGGLGICVAEAEPSRPGNWFNPTRFRPVVTRKSDISIFKAMLKTQGTRISA